MTRKGPLRDTCGGVLPTALPTWPSCPNQAPAVVSSSVNQVEEADLIVGQVGEGRMLAWAATEELSNGDAMGPAALVFWTQSGFDVHAIGTLQGLRNDARLRLHHSGGAPVVILESQQCTPDGVCTPIAQFTPIVSRRFRDVPVIDPEGQCLGRAQFKLKEKLEQPTSRGWVRRFELQRSIELQPEGIILVDLVTGEEYDPRDPEGGAQPFRRVTARRNLEFVEDHFVVRDRDLWTNLLRDYGLVGEGGARDVASGGGQDRDEPEP